MKNLLFAFLAVSTFAIPSFNAHAEGFSTSYAAKAHDTDLKQVGTEDFYFACGAMAVLTANSLFRGVRDDFKSKSDVSLSLQKLYSKTNKRYPAKTSSSSLIATDLKPMFSALGYDSKNVLNYFFGDKEAGYSNIKQYLGKGHAVLVTVDGTMSPYSFPHWVVIYNADNSYVLYLDPWDGKGKRVSKSTFMKNFTGLRMTAFTQYANDPKRIR